MGYIARLRQRVFDHFKEVIEERQGIKVPNRADVRASSLPICWRAVVFQRQSERAGRVPMKEWFLGSALYTGIGNAVHRACQQYIGYAGLLWGSWECLTCGKRWLNQNSPGPCCGALPEYIEYSLDHPDPTIGEFGHCDGLVNLPLGFGWFELELKTTGEELASVRRAKGPIDEHMMQVSAYHDMFGRGMAIVRKRGSPEPGFPKGKVQWEAPAVMPPGPHLPIVLIVYVRRDKPRPRNWVPFVRKALSKPLADVEKYAPRAAKAVTNGKLMPPRCQKFDDAKNPYNWKDICVFARPICFSPDPEAAAQHLFEQSQRGATKPRATVSKPSGGWIPRKSDGG